LDAQLPAGADILLDAAGFVSGATDIQRIHARPQLREAEVAAAVGRAVADRVTGDGIGVLVQDPAFEQVIADRCALRESARERNSRGPRSPQLVDFLHDLIVLRLPAETRLMIEDHLELDHPLWAEQRHRR
jgi:hypothetical protein